MNLEGFPLTLSLGAELARCRNAGRGFRGLCGQAGASWVPGVLVLQVTGAQADAGMGRLWAHLWPHVAGAEATGLTSAHQSTWCLGTGLLSPAGLPPALPPHRPPATPSPARRHFRIRPERTFGPCYGCCYSLSRVRPFVTPDCSLPGSSVHDISQARNPEWFAVSFSRGSSRPRDRTWVSHIAGRVFTS